jgi:2-polyprenyl-3-methyl-5-hydroxy-6-metoxy-1,4-benzoquinol methylase
VLVLYEALYYLQSAAEFLREAKRVLRPGGTLLISTVNCDWGEFNPSPLSTTYYTAAELAEIVTMHAFRVCMFGGFPQTTGGSITRLVGAVRKAAVRLHMIPETQKRKEWLKRLFYGRLTQIPRELEAGTNVAAPLAVLAPPYVANQYRFLYAVATSIC